MVPFVCNIKALRHKAYIRLYSNMPLQKNKIIMWANSFKQFGCSPKYITEYLLEKYPNKFDIVWVFEPQVDVPKGLEKKVRIVRYFSMEYLKELHTAKFIICNMRTGAAYQWHKRKGQIYIQTWHSSLRLKKIEKDAEQYLDNSYISDAVDDSHKIDVLLSGCAFSTEIFKRAFWYDGEIMECGTPRCDVLIGDRKDIKEKVYKYYNIPNDARLLLYAPTFRADKKADTMGMDFEKLKNTLESGGQKWVIGCRLHPNILQELSNIPNAIIMSKYPDMQELISAADLLITDYSSCMFDMAIAKKPCALYAPDLENYLSNERDLYFDILSLPFPVAKNMDELCDKIENLNESEYKENVSRFLTKIGSFETGNATQKVAEFILKSMNN